MPSINKGMWDRLALVSPPVGQFLELQDVKKHLRVDYDDDDDYIYGLIDEVTAIIDGPYGLGISLLTQQWAMSLDRFDDYYIKVPLGPVQSIDSISYLAPDGSQQVLDPSFYVVSYGRTPCTIGRAFGAVWPVVRQTIGAITINFTCGFGSAAQVPGDLKRAAKLIIGNLYENRSAVVGIDSRDSPQEMPLGVENTFARYRPIPFG